MSTLNVTSAPPASSRRVRIVGVTLAVALFTYAATAANAADDAAAAAARASLERVQALRKERPGDGILAFYQTVVHLSLGEREAALDLLRGLKGRKLGLIPVRRMGFDRVWADAEFQAIRKVLENEEPKTPAAPVAFRLADPKLIPEGIAYDPDGKRFFLGSAQRKIIVTDRKGEVRDFSRVDDKLDVVLGLCVDAENGHLYAVSTNGFIDEAKSERRNAVLRYKLKTGRLLDRFVAPDAMQLNDLALSREGTLYVTDSMGGTLFRRQSDERTLTRFGTAGALRGANGIALGAEGNLYVAVSTGILRIDTATGEPTRVPQPDSIVTGGMDGLYWHEGDLFGVQNVTNPGRVVRIHLADKGTRIAGLTVLQSHDHPDFDEPTTGAFADGALHVIGNSYVGRYQPDGTIKDAESLKGTAVIAVPLKR